MIAFLENKIKQKRIIREDFEDFLRTFWGLWWHFEDIENFWWPFDDLLRTFWGIENFWGPFEEYLMTFWGLWGLFEDFENNDCTIIPDPADLNVEEKNLLILNDCFLGKQNIAEAYYTRGLWWLFEDFKDFEELLENVWGPFVHTHSPTPNVSNNMLTL